MKAVTVTVLKKELKHKSQSDLIEICLKLSKFKKENKELLTYLLFDSEDEQEYIRSVIAEIDLGFEELNRDSYYFIKKSCRKILRLVKKNIRYSKKKDTEAQLLLHFCTRLKEMNPPYTRSQQMTNMFEMQLKMAEKAIAALHEDLQYDYGLLVEKLKA